MLTLVAALLTASPVLPAPGFLDVPSGYRFELPGANATVTVDAGQSLRVQDLAKYGTGESGIGYIDWQWNAGHNPDGTKLTFSRPLSFFALRAGDYGGDDDGVLELVAYDCDGRELARAAQAWSTRSPPFDTLQVRARGICSVRYRSGGQYAGSTFITGFRGE